MPFTTLSNESPIFRGGGKGEAKNESNSSSFSSRKEDEENKSLPYSELSTSGVGEKVFLGEQMSRSPDPLASTLAGGNPDLARAGVGPILFEANITRDFSAGSRRLSSSFLKERGEIHQTFYSSGGEGDDDDVTFVDHGSTSMSILPSSMSLHPSPSETRRSENLSLPIGNDGSSRTHSAPSVPHGGRDGGEQAPFFPPPEMEHFTPPAYAPLGAPHHGNAPLPLHQGMPPLHLVGHRGTTSFGSGHGGREWEGEHLSSHPQAGRLALHEGGRGRGEESRAGGGRGSSVGVVLANNGMRATDEGPSFAVAPSTLSQTPQGTDTKEGPPGSFSSSGLTPSSALMSPSTDSYFSSSTRPPKRHQSGDAACSSSYTPSSSSPLPSSHPVRPLPSREYAPLPSGAPFSHVSSTALHASPSPEEVLRAKRMAEGPFANGVAEYTDDRSFMGGAMPGAAVVWHPPRVVSQMRMDQNVRAMTIAPDGKSVWIAIGDDPLTLLEVEGRDLVVSRAVDTITQVYCVAVIKIAGTSQKPFHPALTATPDDAAHPKEEGGGGRRKREKKNRVNHMKEDSYFLWCGLNKGHISIWDLQQQSDMGYIRNAHSTTLYRIWQLPNGNVWTSGLDKAVKVWNPQSRQKIKNRNIAVILADMCFATETMEVWGIAADNVIRVYEAGGDNARLKQTGENIIKMKNDLVLIRYDEDANLVWAGMTKGTSLINPTTYDVLCNLNLTVSALAFHAKTAIVVGRGSLVESESIDRVAVLDITNPLEPTPLFIGSTLEGVTPVGMHLFPANPFALVAQDLGRYQKKSITVFTYMETLPIEKHLAMSVPQDSPRRMTGYFRGIPPPVGSPGAKQTLGYVSAGNTAVPSVSGVGIEGQGIATRNGFPGCQREGGNDTSLPRNGPLTVDYHGAPLTPSQAALTASPVMFEFLEDIERNTKETKNFLTMLTHGQKPAADVMKLQTSFTEWLLAQPAGTLPSLSREETERINREYSTSEGKVLALGLAKLQKGLTSAHRRLAASSEREHPPSASDSSSSIAHSKHTPHAVEGEKNTKNRAASEAVVGHTREKDGRHSSESACTSVSLLAPSLQTNSCTDTADVPPQEGETERERPKEASSNASSSPAPASVPLELSSLLFSLSKAGQQKSFQRQIELFQSYSRRMMERQQALVLGLTRVDQAICTVAQQLQEEATERIGSSDSMPSAQGEYFSFIQQSLTDALQQHQAREGIISSSTPSEIKGFSRRMLGLFHMVSHITQHSLSCEAAPFSPNPSSSLMNPARAVGASHLSASQKRTSAIDPKKALHPMPLPAASRRDPNNGDFSHNSNTIAPSASSGSIANDFHQGTSCSPTLVSEDSLHRRFPSEEDNWKSSKPQKGRLTSAANGDSGVGSVVHPRQSSSSSGHSRSGESTISSLFRHPVSCTQLENLLSHHHFAPGEASRLSASLILIAPSRLLRRLKDELDRVEAFIDEVSQAKVRGEVARRMMYKRYTEGGSIPSLEKDFTQLSPLMDFKETKVLFDICLVEGYLDITETLLTSKGFVSLAQGNGTFFLSQNVVPPFPPSQKKEKDGSKGNTAEHVRFIARLCSKIESFSADVRTSLLRRKEEKLSEEVMTAIRRQSGGFLLTDVPVSAVNQKKYQGAIFWSDVALTLLTACLEAVEALLFPQLDREGNANESYPMSFSNFSLILQQLLEWEAFTLEVEKRFYQFQFIILLCSLESTAVLGVDKFTDSRRSSSNSSSSSSASQNRRGDGNLAVPSGTHIVNSVIDNIKDKTIKEVKKKEDLKAILHRRPKEASSVEEETAESAPQEEPHLRFLALLLYIRERVAAILGKSDITAKQKSRRLSQLFQVDSARITFVLKKCVSIRKYTSFLLHRAEDLQRSAVQTVDAHGANALLIPSTVPSHQEHANEDTHNGAEGKGLSMAEKLFCKELKKL